MALAEHDRGAVLQRRDQRARRFQVGRPARVHEEDELAACRQHPVTHRRSLAPVLGQHLDADPSVALRRGAQDDPRPKYEVANDVRDVPSGRAACAERVVSPVFSATIVEPWRKRATDARTRSATRFETADRRRAIECRGGVAFG